MLGSCGIAVTEYLFRRPPIGLIRPQQATLSGRFGVE
jgi:hypothetical protein